jgi:hypothetical protein
MREVIDSDGALHRLTVTPDRVTIKLVRGREDRDAVRAFAERVADRMLAEGGVVQSWRGAVKSYNGELTVSLQTDRGLHCRYIKESDLACLD